MTTAEIKEYILNNNCAEQILEELGCGHIRNHGDYLTASNPDGDNKQSINLYLNDNLTCLNHTRNLTKNKRSHDIFDLISFFKDYTFPQTLKWVCETLGLDYYGETEEKPMSLQILQLLKEMATNDKSEDNISLKPIPEKILEYYFPYGNRMWEDDNVSLETQKFFELSFDPQSNSICIPIRDELGTLIAVKARRLEYNPELGESKYFFLEPGAKSRVLYALFQNMKMIQKVGVVFVGESEKFCHQLYDLGYYGVSTGGTKISKTQIEMLTRLNVKIVFCYDKDVSEEELKNISDGFMDGIQIYAIIDRDNILDEKESPSDNPTKWEQLVKNNIYKIKGDSN